MTDPYLSQVWPGGKTKTEKLEKKLVEPMANSYSPIKGFSDPRKTEQIVEPQPSAVVAEARQTNVDAARLRYEEQESKRAPRIQVDQWVVLISWLIAVGIAIVTSAVISFNGISSVGSFVGLSYQWMSNLFFFFVECMYLVFLVAYLVLASRVDEKGVPEKTAGALFGMWFFAGVGIVSNAFHTLQYHNWNWADATMYAGLILSVSAPIAIISASKLASNVVFARSIRREE